MHELMFQAGVKGMSERSELIPCNNYYNNNKLVIHFLFISGSATNVLLMV